VIIDSLERVLRRLPDENLLAVAGAVSRALLIANEIEPSPAKVRQAELLRTISVSAGDSVDSFDRRG
jgi:hypothetical protein